MKKIVVLSLLVIAGILFTSQTRKGFLSFIMVLDSVRPPAKALMGKFLPEPSITTVTVPTDSGRTLRANLYSPKGGGAHTPLLIVHGVDPAGRNDKQLVILAANLARAGFLVLVPDFEGMKNFRLRLSDAEDIVRSFLFLGALKNARPGGGMVGMRYGAGPMLLAASDDRLRGRVGLLATFGGYCDARAVLLFLLTGHYDYGGQRGYVRTDGSFRWLFLYKNLDLVRSRADRETLGAIIEKRNRYELAGADALARTLGPEGNAVFAFVANTEQERFALLFERLPLPLREDMVRLSPGRALKQTGARFIIVHSMDDYFVPYTESMKLADTVGDSRRVHLALLPRGLSGEQASTEGGWYERLLSAWRLCGAFYDLLGKAER